MVEETRGVIRHGGKRYAVTLDDPWFEEGAK
jgi:hypothetical protein